MTRTVILAAVILLPWLFVAPWIAKGYGSWHWPNPFAGYNGAVVDGLFFYLPPIFVAALFSRKLLRKY